MKAKLTLRDPTPELASALRARKPPPSTLSDKQVALLDIGKTRGDEYIDRLQRLFEAKGIVVRRYKKPTNTRTAPIELLQTIATECDVAVIALSDCGSCTSCSTHDLNELDLRGVPGVSVLTTEFSEAFLRQCTGIGFDGAAVFIPHPIQNRTTEELHELANASFERIVSKICGSGSPLRKAA